MSLESPPSSSPIVPRPPPPQEDFTIGWICVLQKEYFAAMTVLDEEYDGTADIVRGQGDVNDYSLGFIGKHNVVINVPQAETCGEIHAQNIATNMKSTFPMIRFLLLVGIGGGAPLQTHDIRLGDVVLGTRVIPYAFGRGEDFAFERTGKETYPPPELLTAITKLVFRLQRKELNLSRSIESFGIKEGYGQNATPRPSQDRLYINDYIHQSGCDCLDPQAGIRSRMVPREPREGDLVQIHQGNIGAASIVMKNALFRDNIAVKEKILCFEMEATGVMGASHCLPIRGISDYADGHKNDAWHSYAALAAAVCAREILISIPAQTVSQYPPKFDGDELSRYIHGGVENANTGQTYYGDTLRSMQRALSSLMERHDLVQHLLTVELQKLHDLSRSDLQEVQDEAKKLIDLQEELKKSIRVLRENVENQLRVYGSQDFDPRREWKELRKQVREETKKVERISKATQGALESTGSLLEYLGKSINTEWLSIAGRVMKYGSELVGHLANLWPDFTKRSSTSEKNPMPKDALPPSESSHAALGEKGKGKKRQKLKNILSPMNCLSDIGQVRERSDETIPATSGVSYQHASHQQHPTDFNNTSGHPSQSPNSSNDDHNLMLNAPTRPPPALPTAVRSMSNLEVPMTSSTSSGRNGASSSQSSNTSVPSIFSDPASLMVSDSDYVSTESRASTHDQSPVPTKRLDTDPSELPMNERIHLFNDSANMRTLNSSRSGLL